MNHSKSSESFETKYQEKSEIQSMKRLHTLLFLSMIVIFSLGTVYHATAQEAFVFPDTLKGYKLTWKGTLNGTQVSYNNWAKGGSNSISVTSGSILTLLYQKERLHYGVRLDTRYGRARVNGNSNRKTDDRLSFRNRILYDITNVDGMLRIYSDIHFLTQFADGFEYAKNDTDPDVLISGWLSPAYLTESVGLMWQIKPKFSIESGIGLKQTFVTDQALASRYGIPDGEQVRNEGGVTIGVSLEQEMMPNVTYTLGAETFSTFQGAFNETDVSISNLIVGKINSYLNMTFQFNLVYDRDFSTKLQTSQLLAAGLSVIL